ncbi:PilN domain-containing protein [Schlegelella sp. S2-27]|uniref:PilN domain-containing protein n=1 Tax=Caldimonas mangrovi TaxID=2944811 RepID=A0ABT0YS56_9BURK|nr:PilN domain-containing protein [Caldimonas mangrovi]MCM5681565.1 PilN domain-containing protein [Caldimonas mangrovi]
MGIQHVNFARRGISFGGGVAILCAGALCAAWALKAWDNADHQTSQLTTEMAALRAAQQQDGSRLEPAAHLVARYPEASRALQIDWQRIFTALEAPLPEGIRLESVAPDVAAGTIRIAGQADTMAGASDYLARLTMAGLSQVRLVSHQALDPAAPSGPIRFALVARWNEHAR